MTGHFSQALQHFIFPLCFKEQGACARVTFTGTSSVEGDQEGQVTFTGTSSVEGDEEGHCRYRLCLFSFRWGLKCHILK